MLTRILSIVFIFCLFTFAESQGQIVEPYYHFFDEDYLNSRYLYDSGLLRLSEETLLDALKKFPSQISDGKSVILLANIDCSSENYSIGDRRLELFIKDYPNSPFVPFAAILRAYSAYDQKLYERSENLFAQTKLLAEKDFDIRKD